MTPEIEKIQTEIGLNMINLVPVPWEKICFRAICNESSSDIYYCFCESETGIISSCDNEDTRYISDWYKVELSDTVNNLLVLAIKLFVEYQSVNPPKKMWKAFTYILNKDYDFNIEFEYESEDTPLLSRRQWSIKYFGEKSLYYYKGLYPDTTDVIT